MIGIVDYNAGNITSVERALKFIGSPYILSKNPEDLKNCSKIIFPGVGEAKYAMEQLNKTGFDEFLKDCKKSGRPLMGICLGSQIIFDWSEEGDVACLGLIPGKIKSFHTLWKEKNIDYKSLNLKSPQIGYNDLEYKNSSSKLLNGIEEHSDFYFVHSYVICPDDYSVVKASCNYGIEVPSCVEYENVTAFQFHPEKSGEKGLKILRNFVEA